MPRFSIDVDDAFDATLNGLVENTDATTKADVIRRAVASYKYLKDELSKDPTARVSLTDKSGTKDVILP